MLKGKKIADFLTLRVLILVLVVGVVGWFCAIKLINYSHFVGQRQELGEVITKDCDLLILRASHVAISLAVPFLTEESFNDYLQRFGSIGWESKRVSVEQESNIDFIWDLVGEMTRWAAVHLHESGLDDDYLTREILIAQRTPRARILQILQRVQALRAYIGIPIPESKKGIADLEAEFAEARVELKIVVYGYVPDDG